MKRTTIFIILLLTAAALFVAGCTESSAPPGPSTTITTVPTTVPATSAVVTPPATTVIPDYKTEPLPRDKTVAVSVDRNSVNPNITITYRGGPGINFVSLMETVLTRSDGVLVRDSIRKPQVNDKITIQGTRELSEARADHLQVFITLVTGDKYLIYNETLPYKSSG
jgi:hypothetical protein